MKAHPVSLFLLFLPFVPIPSAQAQEWEPTCGPDCRFQMERVFSLGDDDEGLVGPEARVARIGTYYYIADQDWHASIQVFHRDSGFVGTIGRAGEGPGEFKNILDIDADSSGNLWVLDAGQRRLSKIKAKGSESSFLGTYPIPHSWVNRFGLTLLPDGRFLLNATIATPGEIGMWTHLVDPDTGVEWSIEDNPRSEKGLEPEWRSFALDGGDGFWLAWRHGQYRLEHRRLTDGSLVDAISPKRNWFQDNREERPISRGEDPHSGAWMSAASVLDIFLRGNRLWVLGEYGTREGLRQIIEVFDVGTQTLLHSHNLPLGKDRYFVQFDDDGLAVECELTGQGIRLHFWSITLRQSRSR